MMQPAGILDILSKLLPILILIAMGYVLRRTRFVSEQAMEGIKKIAVNLALPIVIFLSLLELDFESAYIVLALSVFLVSILLLCVGTGIGKLLHWENPYIPALFTGFENGMLGYGILAVTFGQDNIYPIIIMDLGQTFFFSLVFITYMKVKNREISSVSPKNILKTFAVNPYVWASVLAIVLRAGGCVQFLTDNPPARGLLESLKQLSNLATPLMCLAIGYGLKVNQRSLKRSLLLTALRLVILLSTAALFDAFIIKGLLHLGSLFSAAAYTMFMLPPFFVGALLIKEEAVEEREFALSTISIHILVFFIFFCIAMPLLRPA